jgi:hypothetical protein
LNTVARVRAQTFKTPPEPDPPTGATNSLRVFRASKSYFHYRLLIWGFRQIGTVLGILAVLYFDANYDIRDFLGGAPEYALVLIRIGEKFAIVGLAVQLPVTFFLTQLDYRYRWYMTTDHSLRIREGVANVREQTMMFSNLQNVAIRQGPLQRLFGISDLEVRSAGGASEKTHDNSGQKEDMHLGYFRGVSNAAEIRDLILDYLRRAKGPGLGDPADVSPTTTEDDTVTAGRLLLDEAKALRRALN